MLLKSMSEGTHISSTRQKVEKKMLCLNHGIEGIPIRGKAKCVRLEVRGPDRILRN